MKRMLIMLGALLSGMGLVAGVLMLLDPGPVSEPAAMVIHSSDRTNARSPESLLFDTAPSRRWEAIMVHSDSAAVGHHFLVRQGADGGADRIEVQERWRRQDSAAWQAAGDPRLVRTISIACDGRVEGHELAWLVNRLQTHYRIPPERVMVRSGAPATLPLAQR